MLLRSGPVFLAAALSGVQAATPFCASVANAVSAGSGQSAATSFCENYLDVSTTTVTAGSTKTHTVTTTTSVTVTTEAAPTATTTVVETFTTTPRPADNTETSTSTFTVLGPDFTCTPGHLSKRAAEATPKPFATLSSGDEISSACGCLSVAAPTSTVTTTHTATSTITKTVSGGVDTLTITTTTKASRYTNYFYTTVTSTTTVGANAYFGIQVADKSISILGTYSESPQDFFYAGPQSVGDPFQLQGDDCELYDAALSEYALQTTGGMTGQLQAVYPSDEGGAADGENVTCEVDLSTLALRCHDPYGGDQAYLCDWKTKHGSGFRHLYLGKTGLENSTCVPVNLIANPNYAQSY